MPPFFTRTGLHTLDRVDPVTQLALSGPLLLAAGVALAAGVISFASPCVVPLVPGYLAYLAALVGADAPTADTAERNGRRRFAVVGAAALFVAGFTVVLTIGLGGVVWLTDVIEVNRGLLQRIGGVLIIALALAFLGFIPWAQREYRFRRTPRAGVWGAPLLGMVFGLGWTPCLGPTLAAVTVMASSTGGAAARGFFLVLLYCLGLGVPFLLIALGARWAVRVTDWLRRNSRRVQLVGGGMLLLVGVLLVSGLWAELVAWLRDSFVADVRLPL